MNRPTPPRATRPAAGAPAADALYERAKALAASPDKAVRRKLAEQSDLRPELLYYLAEDAAPEVRRAVADNRRSPVHADLILARDGDEGVRARLVTKIAELVPELSERQRGRLYELTCEVIEVLARDQLPRVRAVLAEALAEVTGAPPRLAAVIRGLARDEVFDVAAPVLERSTVLTDDDVIEIINADPAAWALACIARRPHVGPTVADAVAHGGDVDAIATLLGNPSAQIREETLDRIVDRAPAEPSWHGPLVRRPKLSARSASRIAEFVADSLLDLLRQRTDLDAATSRAVSAAVKRRLDAKTEEDGGFEPSARPAARDAAIERAARLHAEGKLDDDVVARAVNSGERAFVIAALALRGDLKADVVRAILSSGSAKSVVALAWRAGIPMRIASQMQIKLAGIAPAGVLAARGDGYPLAEEDMQWQIEFFGG